MNSNRSKQDIASLVDFVKQHSIYYIDDIWLDLLLKLHTFSLCNKYTFP